MASLVTLPALDTFSGTRLGALLGVVAFLLTVLASMWVDALLGTVAGSVTFFTAINALHGGCHGNVFGLLLLTVL